MTVTMTPAPVVTEMDRLVAQRDRLFQILKDTYESTNLDRYTKLMKMYVDYGDRLIEAPASGKVHYHNAYEGGYIDHILHVYDNALEYAKVLKKTGGWVDFNRAELTMAAIHHDLWKLGIPKGHPYYELETSDWHRKNQGSMYKNTDKLPYMKVTDGAVFLLQMYGIALTQNEWLSIKLSDGLYDDSNKGYLMNHGKYPIHTNLPYVIHWADHMSCVAERDPLKQEYVESLDDDGA